LNFYKAESHCKDWKIQNCAGQDRPGSQSLQQAAPYLYDVVGDKKDQGWYSGRSGLTAFLRMAALVSAGDGKCSGTGAYGWGRPPKSVRQRLLPAWNGANRWINLP
jgi:hypothetical protein